MKRTAVSVALVMALVVPAAALAHFQVLVPTSDVVSADGEREVDLCILFTHPMEGKPMDMAKPVRFGVSVRGGEAVDLLKTLEQTKAGDKQAWTAAYAPKRPGDHVFFVEPAPYWEPAEEKFIVHYTKVVVNAYGLQEGWDHELGLPTEIVPLVRPYGLWAGNVFRGIVKLDGEPVPFAEIEVEYYNEPGHRPARAPTDPHTTQVIKADGNGVFAYAMPRAGWWGFAALSEADYTLRDEEGTEREVELGAVMWVKTFGMN